MQRVITAFIATVAGLVLLLSFKTGAPKSPVQSVALVGSSPDAIVGSSPVAVVSSSPHAVASSGPGAVASSSQRAVQAPHVSSVSSSLLPSPSPSASPVPSTSSSAQISPSAQVSSSAQQNSPSEKTLTGPAVSVGEGGQVFGSVQVRLTVFNNMVTSITELQYPKSNAYSAQISDFAIPMLRSETLTTQGVGVDVVSGATYTSAAYAKSVQAALDSAKS